MIRKKQLVLVLMVLVNFVIWGETQKKVKNDVALISVEPGTIYIVNEGTKNSINFDFVLKGITEENYNIFEILCDVYDKEGELVVQRHLRWGGISPSTLTIPNRDLKPGEPIVVFNPFHSFGIDISLHRMKFVFRFATPDWKKLVRQEIEVNPVFPELNTVHSLPVKEDSVIDDGNDFYSHHRRIDITHKVSKMLGIKTNSGRYAMDFMGANGEGKAKKGEGEILEDYYGFGMPVRATAEGEVITVKSDMEDAAPGTVNFDMNEVVKNKQTELFSGNYVIIKYSDREYGHYMHLKKNSILVKPGDKVKRGQIISKLGNSGASYYPHLHFQVSSSGDMENSEGVPAYFHNFEFIRGSETLKVKKGYINTGDRVRSL